MNVSNNTSAASPEGGDINPLQCLFVIRTQFAFSITSFNDLNNRFHSAFNKNLRIFFVLKFINIFKF